MYNESVQVQVTNQFVYNRLLYEGEPTLFVNIVATRKYLVVIYLIEIRIFFIESVEVITNMKSNKRASSRLFSIE
jgi:hypothetical protein